MKNYLITVSAKGYKNVEIRVKAKSIVTAKKSQHIALSMWFQLNKISSCYPVIWTTTTVKI